jgi:hypothetical protein
MAAERKLSDYINVSSGPGYAIVKLTGEFTLAEINDTVKIYEEILNKGASRILIDTSLARTDFSLLLKAKIELHQVLAKFDRIGILCGTSENAFKLKVLSQANPRAMVYYKPADAEKWLSEK